MIDYKLEAAKEALKFIKPNQFVGVGAGTSIAHLLQLLSNQKALSSTLTFASSSFKTANLINELGFNFMANTQIKKLDIYFDGCDQLDRELNALKSGGGIHTTEKILAAMANEFILIGDASKFVPVLNTTYPFVIEVLPAAVHFVMGMMQKNITNASSTIRMSTQKDGAVITENGNFLIDVYFTESMQPEKLNTIKMVPGVVEHSLFYKMASKAIIAGEDGIRIISAMD